MACLLLSPHSPPRTHVEILSADKAKDLVNYTIGHFLSDFLGEVYVQLDRGIKGLRA